MGVAPLSGLPDAVDRLIVNVLSGTGEQIFQKQLTRGTDDLGERTVLLERIPATPVARLQLLACAGGRLAYVGTSTPFPLKEKAKAAVTVQIRPVDRVSCTGTGQSSDFNTYAALGRERVFPAVATLPDGRVFIGSGAGQISQGASSALVGAGALGGDYDTYDPVDTLFPPSLSRTVAEVGNRLRAPRVLAQAFFVGPAEAPGILIVGGADPVSWSTQNLGPLSAVDGVVAQPFVERLDIKTETSVPVVPSLGPALTPRFLPAAAQDPGSGLVVIAGGIEYPNLQATPSAVGEMIRGRALLTFALDQPRVGASLTPLGDDRFLLWGGDVQDCGAVSALIVDANATPPVRALPITATDPPPTCDTSSAGRAWLPTAYHVATDLGADFDGTRRILISGGLELHKGAVETTPDIGGASHPPNLFVLTVPATLEGATLEALVPPADIAPKLKRAFHGAVRVGNRVVVGGGWTPLPGGLVGLNASPDLVTIDLAVGTIPTFSAPPLLALSEARLGNVMTPTADGAVLFAGGIHRDVVGAIIASKTAEIYQPPLAFDPCVGSGNPVPVDFGFVPLDGGVDTDAEAGAGPIPAPDAARFDASRLDAQAADAARFDAAAPPSGP